MVSCIERTMARRKKRVEEEQENHERWLVSYADFITLLFAFFVVMYSVSSVNDGKYRVLSKSLVDAFSEKARSLDPIQVGEIASTNVVTDAANTSSKSNESENLDEVAQLVRISNQIEEVLSPYIDQELIDIKRDDLWVEVEMKSGMLFQSGRADLADEAFPVLKKIAEIIRQTPNTVHIEGYTDNLPINTIEFPSNWELSAARAASVVHQFSINGVDPKRLAAIGYGEHHPIADNRFEKGRYENRRVVLVLLSQSAARHKLVSDERTKLLASTPKLPSKKKIDPPAF